MPILTIDAKDFFRGVSTTDELADGGFSPLSKGINLFASPGLLLPGRAPTDSAGSVSTGGIFAWSTHHTNISPGIGRGVGNNASLDGKFFTLADGGGATLMASDTGRDYKPNETDLIRFGTSNEQFSTSQTNIGKSDYEFGVNDFTWWTVTLGKTALGAGVPHHFVQYGSFLYITDGRYLHSWDGATGTYNALDLPDGYVITDITVYNNLIFMAAAKFDPLGGGESINCRIFTWDSISDSFLDEFPVQERIDSLIVFGGTLMVTTQRYIGYFTGSTISPLYPLTTNVYKYQWAITNDRLYLLQDTDVLCYGNPVMSRPKFFSFPLRHTSSLIGITSYRSGKIVYSLASAAGSWSDVNGSDKTGDIYYGNRIAFGRLVKIRAVIVESEALSSGSDIDLAYINDTATTKTVGSYDFATLGAVLRHQFDLFNHAPTFTFQPKITFTATTNKGIRRIHVWYEATELKPNK